MEIQSRTPVVFITGAGVGLGRELALTFGSEGCQVAVTGIEGTSDTAEAIRARDGKAVGIRLDLIDPPQVDAAVEQVLEKWGRIDVLVNNAGIIGPTARLVDVSLADWESTLKVNLTGAFLCDQAVSRHMISRRSGSIIHISSTAGTKAFPLRSPYAVSKRGLIALTETLAAELGPYNVRVNAVCPGPLPGDRMDRVIARRAKVVGLSQATLRESIEKMSALGRMVTAQDVCRLVVFLASDAALNITGQTIKVCAGHKL